LQEQDAYDDCSASDSLSNKPAGIAEKVLRPKAVLTTQVGVPAETASATATPPNAPLPDQTDDPQKAALANSSRDEKAMPESDTQETNVAELNLPELTNVQDAHIGKKASTPVSVPPAQPLSTDTLISNDPIMLVTDAGEIDSITQKKVLLRRFSFQTRRKSSFQMLMRTRSARKFGPSLSEPSLPEMDDRGPMEPSPLSFASLPRKLSKRSAR
jgi:hypothetical protein